MTEGSTAQNEKPMCVRIWLEVGHACVPRRPLGRAISLDWHVWVRGICGTDISAFVHKVVFHLHPSSAFVYPKRVLQEPPYEIHESGCSSIDIPIHVYLKYSKKPKRIRLKYSLRIEHVNKSSEESSRIFYDLENPSEQLWRSLMKSGAEIVGRVGGIHNGSAKLVTVLSDRDSGDDRHKNHRHSTNTKKCKFVKPARCKHGPRKDTKYVSEDNAPKNIDQNTIDFKKLLRSAEMTGDEIERVSQLYLAFSGYEKTENALILPPLSDPIYCLPDLPLSLRDALSSIEKESNLATQ